MASYVVIYPNIVGISLGHKYRLEWMVLPNGLSILVKNDACLLTTKDIKAKEILTTILTTIVREFYQQRIQSKANGNECKEMQKQ